MRLLPEQDRIASVIIEELNSPNSAVNSILELAAQVYEGLSDEEIETVEQIALDRSCFCDLYDEALKLTEESNKT